LRAAMVLALLAGCTATTSIETNKDQSYTKEPKRLLVIESMLWNTAWLYQPFQSSLSQHIHACGVIADYIKKTPSEPLNAQAIAFARRFHPDTILEISEVSRTLQTRNGSPTGVILWIEYTLEIKDVATDKTVWKADDKLMPNFSTSGQGEVLARNIVAKLSADGIFHSCPAATN
jgi:hypothetical protein